MRATCPACDHVEEVELALTPVGERYDFMDGSFVYPDYAPSDAAREARCGGCGVRWLFFDAVELDALHAAGLLHERVVADRRGMADKARRAEAGCLDDVPAELIALVPREMARDWQVIPFAEDPEHDEVQVAFSPWILSKYEERRLGGFIDRHVRGFAVSERELVDALVRYYGWKREEL